MRKCLAFDPSPNNTGLVLVEVDDLQAAYSCDIQVAIVRKEDETDVEYTRRLLNVAKTGACMCDMIAIEEPFAPRGGMPTNFTSLSRQLELIGVLKYVLNRYARVDMYSPSQGRVALGLKTRRRPGQTKGEYKDEAVAKMEKEVGQPRATTKADKRAIADAYAIGRAGLILRGE